MDGIDVLLSNSWTILFLFLLIYPRLQQSIIQMERNNALKSLSKKRKSNVITLIHRQETLSLLGLPLSRYIDIDDSEELLRVIRLTPEDQSIDLIIHTPGGIALAATQIAFALKAHKGKTVVIVPHYAMSGGTLIALAADEILMDEHAVLGPVDPQMQTSKGVVSASSILRVLEKKKIDEIDDETLYFAEEARKALEQTKDTVRKLISDKYDLEKTEEIVNDLVTGKYTHDYPITAEKVCSLLGQCTTTRLPKEVYELMNLYKMGKPQKTGIEYVPVTQ
ncbi:ATP-dependent Clp protease proteolytic subunit [Candidatus Bathyarchaeota archaeon]|nr:ATP-dependent Clp protease proteolytic subunit [Candidatus Bathyarchaeota archaeon]